MRIWSLHPKYLDSKGLVALWRETLLAKHVLEGKTKGYKNHPQLNRFKEMKSPVNSINHYLEFIYEEACLRNFNFDKSKIQIDGERILLPVTIGQIEYETNHLLGKLIRDGEKLKELKSVEKVIPHPLFYVVKGEIEKWEII